MFSNSRIAWSMISRVDRVRVRRQIDRLLSFELPNHISIIMDGNRRFAWNRMLGQKLDTDTGRRSSSR